MSLDTEDNISRTDSKLGGRAIPSCFHTVRGKWGAALMTILGSSSAVWRWVALAFLTLMGIWPAALNRQPFFFDDTSAYIRGADAGVSRLLRVDSSWTENAAAPALLEAPNMTYSSALTRKSLSNIEEKAVLAGRSVYYGAFLYIGALSSFWLNILLQSFISATAILLTAINLNLQFSARNTILMVLVIIMSPLPFFNSILMPDVFAALCILACVNLVSFWPNLNLKQRAFWWGLLTAGILFHSSHFLITASVILVATPLLLIRHQRTTWMALLAVAFALVVGAIGDFAFSLAVQHLVGAPPIRPPFMMARIIADGPGRTFIKERCDGFEVCHFRENLTDSADAFLWELDPAKGGVFAIADAETRRKLSQEQFRFVAAVLAAYPQEQLAASLHNAARQLSEFGLEEFNYTVGSLTGIAEKIPEPHRSALLASTAAMGGIPVHVVEAFTMVVLGLSVIVLTFQHRALSHFYILILVGVIANAAICGALSTPHHRYQARIIWLVPVLAVIAMGRGRAGEGFRSA